MWMSHITYVTKSYHTCERVMSHGLACWNCWPICRPGHKHVYCFLYHIYCLWQKPHLSYLVSKKLPQIGALPFCFFSLHCGSPQTYVYYFLYQQVPWYMGVLRSGPVSWVPSNQVEVSTTKKERKTYMIESCHVWMRHVAYVKYHMCE